MAPAPPVQNASPVHVVQAQHHLDEKAPDGVLRQRAVDLVDQVMKRAARGKLCHNVQPALQGEQVRLIVRGTLRQAAWPILDYACLARSLVGAVRNCDAVGAEALQVSHDSGRSQNSGSHRGNPAMPGSELP